MRTVKVETSSGSYDVRIGFASTDSEFVKHDFLLVDSKVANLHGFPETPKSLDYAASEETKTLATCESVLSRMSRSGFGKGDSLMAIGGGATQDVATFCASVYMRGVAWTYAPTTAMAMFDSCIGGKSSINLGQVKNLVGNIYPPTEVVVDLSFIETLDPVALVSGFSEAVKICFAAGSRSFDQYLEFAIGPNDFIKSANSDQATSFVAHVLDSKRFFIEIDEFDKAERRLLNFGHTFAHALESASKYQIPHGVAVGLGMAAALKHPDSARNGQTQMLEHYLITILSNVSEVVDMTQVQVDWELFEMLIASDKKATRETIRLILPAKSGGLEIVEVPRIEKSFSILQTCMNEALVSVGV